MTKDIGGVLPPPLIFVALLLLSIALHWIAPMHIPGKYHWVRYPIGAHLIIVAGALALRAYHLMRKHKTPVDFSNPTRVIITEGPFRYTRNPLYLSLLMLFLGIAIALNSLWFIPFFVCMFAMFNAIAKKEEAYLEARFGEVYSKYRKSVRRWL